jgi:ribose transport system permease protein
LSTTLLADELPAGRGRALAVLAGLWSWLFLMVLLAFFEVWAHAAYRTSFLLNVTNLQSIGVFAVAPLLLAVGQTYVIIAGGIDLSVGFIMGFATVVMAQATATAEPVLGPLAAFLIGCVAALVGAAIPGLINGVVVSRLKVPPFIGTLGMYGVARGAGFLLANGTTVPVSNPILFGIGNGQLAGIPVPVLIAAAVVIVLQYGLSQTRYGQYTYAIGGNRQAAIRAGINVRCHTLLLYVLAALCAGVSGFIYTARFSAGAAQAGEPLLLDSIAAVVIGGASLFGGSGTIIGTVIGALIIAVIQYGLVFVDVEPFWQFIAVGMVIVISVLVDQSRLRLTAGTHEDE